MNKKHYLMLMAVCCMALFSTGCASTGNGEFWSDLGRKEGMAASRVLASPLSMVGGSYAEIQENAPTSIYLSPFVLCYTIPAGVVAMCKDIVVGCAEMFSGQKFSDFMYPWESFDMERSEDWRNTSRYVFLGVCCIPLIYGMGYLNIQTQRDEGVPLSFRYSEGKRKLDYSGFGRIQGPSRLQRGKTGIYYLHIGTKRVYATIRWQQKGTCITVHENGNFARVIAGMPQGSSDTARLEAHFNGRVFTKTITVYR